LPSGAAISIPECDEYFPVTGWVLKPK